MCWISSGALPAVHDKKKRHRNRFMPVFCGAPTVLFLFFPKKLYMYIPKYMSHLIKKLYLIFQSFSDIKGEKRGNNNNNKWTSITWFSCGRHERGRDMCTLTLLQHYPGAPKVGRPRQVLWGGYFPKGPWSVFETSYPQVVPTDKICELVLTSGTRPLRKKSISLLTYRGEGWILPRSHRSPFSMQ